MRCEALHLCGGSNLETKQKRLSIIFATFLATKQGASVSSDTARLCDWCVSHKHGQPRAPVLTIVTKRIANSTNVCYNTI